MGDPKKLKKKYSTPAHPWDKANIDANRIIRKEYGLKIRKEVLIGESFLKKYKNIAKNLIASQTEQGKKEKKQMMDKLNRLGLLSVNAELDDVLSLEIKDILERRLQSLVFRKGLARTMTQARQFIVHRHITVSGKEITSPSYLVSTEEEAAMAFKAKSSLFDEEHPERVDLAKKIQEEAEAIRVKKEEAESKKEKEKAKAEPKSEEVKAEPKKAKAETKTEEVKAEPKKEKAKAETKTEEVKAEPKKEKAKEETKSEEVKAEPIKEEAKEAETKAVKKEEVAEK